MNYVSIKSSFGTNYFDFIITQLNASHLTVAAKRESVLRIAKQYAKLCFNKMHKQFYYNVDCFPQKLRFCAIAKRYKIAQIHTLSKQFYNVVKINIQIFALRLKSFCICFANTDDGYAVYIYYNTILP